MHAAGLALTVAIALLSSPLRVAAADARAPEIHVVVIENMVFTPTTLQLRSGDIVEWQNRDLFQHTATARSNAFDVDLAPGASARTVVTAGTIAVYCRFHPNMTATLVVD